MRPVTLATLDEDGSLWEEGVAQQRHGVPIIDCKAACAVGMALAMGSLSRTWANDQRHFDLLCHGTEKYVDSHQVFAPRTVQQLYRIDLDRNLWCSSRCEKTKQIKSADDLHIVLSSVEENGLSDRIVVDQLGKRVDYSTGAGYGSEFKGLVGRVNCKTMPFTRLDPPAF